MVRRGTAQRSLALLAALVVGAVILLAIWYSAGSGREEAAFWPYLLLALCPLLHLFMHRSHGGGHTESPHD